VKARLIFLLIQASLLVALFGAIKWGGLSWTDGH
jgi:hypothetical protein